MTGAQFKLRPCEGNYQIMVTKDTLVEDIVHIPGVVSYFIQQGVSPVTCTGAYPQNIGRLLEIKKLPNPNAFIEGLSAFLRNRRRPTSIPLDNAIGLILNCS